MDIQKVDDRTEKTRLLQALISNNHRVASTKEVKEAAHQCGIDPDYTPHLISVLIQDGWLTPLKKGLYKLSQATGISPVHEFEIAMHLVKPAMISYYSAFYHHGLTDQVPKRVYITTLKGHSIPHEQSQTRRARFKLADIEYQIVQLKKERYYGEIQAWRGEGGFKVADLERTLIEGFASPHYCGGFNEVMQGLMEGLEKVNLKKLIDYALGWDVAVSRRVGWALEELGIENALLTPLVQRERSGYRRLDPSRPAQGHYSKQWLLQINLSGE
jgi:predicted transcriptional regulator of viral defense system